MSEDRKPRRVFSAEFKTEAARLVVDQGMRRARVAKDLGVSQHLIGKWVQDYQKSGSNAFPGKGKAGPQDQRIRELEQENRQLRMERDILKKATAFFANHGR
jgi:transposase